MMREVLAFDRGSVRTYDKFGRLHVAVAHISKANVCPYRGNEIPGWRALGLDPDRVYQLLRAPEELAKAAPTFNNLPLLRGHAPQTAASPQQDRVVGSLGTDARFEAPYLDNSLVIQVQDAIDAVEADEERELSASYSYRAEMTPGEYGGVHYDGVMRDIVGNHVALVPDGRAGDEVMVGDAAMAPRGKSINKEIGAVAKKIVTASPRAAVAIGALTAYLAPRLAQDAVMPDLGPVVAGVTARNWLQKKALVNTRLLAVMKGVPLAKDADLKDVHGLLDRLDGRGEGERERGPEHVEAKDGPNGAEGNNPREENTDPEETVPITGDDDPSERVCEYLQDKLDPEDLEAVRQMLKPADATVAGETEEEKAKAAKLAEEARMRGDRARLNVDHGRRPARDAEPGTARPMTGEGIRPGDRGRGAKDEGMTKTAMDAALLRTRKETETAVVARMNAIREAERAVRPYVGDPAVAFDSAEAVYRWALDTLGVDAEGVHESALPRMLAMVPTPEDQRRNATPRLGYDAKASKGWAERWPDAARIRMIG